MADEIVALLRNPDLRKSVIENMVKICSYAGTLRDNPSEDMDNLKEDELLEEAWWRAEIYGKKENIYAAFDKYVMSKLSLPNRISIDEIVDTFFAMAREPDLADEALQEIYRAFVNYIDSTFLRHRFEILSICRTREDDEYFEAFCKGVSFGFAKARGEEISDRVIQDLIEQTELWSKSGITIRINGLGSKISGYRDITVSIEALMSTKAWEQLHEELARILQSTIRSMTLLFSIDNSRLWTKIPIMNLSLLKEHKHFIKSCLETYYKNPDKKDSLNKRIRNAICLLVEADLQSNHAIALALSIGAIEALLGEKGTEVVEKISRNTAAILEPDPSKRDKAEKFIKDLYDLRSRTLHGEMVEGEEQAFQNARHLAAGVLTAVISRRDFRQMAGYDTETPQDLFKDIREKRNLPGQPDAVPELNVRRLWCGL